MKIFKKVSYLLCLLLLVPLIAFAMPKSSSNVAGAADEPIIELDIFRFISISQQDQAIKTKNIKKIENDAYVIANGSVTINLKPLEFNYYFETPLNSSLYVPLTDTVVIEKDPEIGDYPLSFTYNETEYFYRILPEDHVINIYLNDPSGSVSATPNVSSFQTSLVSYNDDESTQTRTISITHSYVYTNEVAESQFLFQIRGITSTAYSIYFNRPVVKFANAEEPIVKFVCNGLDAGNSEYVDNTIRREQAYLNLRIDFLNNNYTETNPLFFDINYNGFIYTFELYSKTYGTDDLLFVNYKDAEKETNNKYLASALIDDGTGTMVVDGVNKIFKMNGSEFNLFSLIFDRTGRYDIKIYDSTYVYELKNSNFYQTSFYIKDETVTAFENIYIIAQTYDDENKPLEYIVSTSTLNNNVLTTIKNLKNLGKDAGGNPILLEDVIEKIEVRKTTFGGSTNIPTRTTYSVADVNEQLASSNDFSLMLSEDAYYEITVYKKNSSSFIYYEFTIVKHAKTTFSVPVVDSEGEPVFDSNGKQKLDTYDASMPYHTEIINYEKNILSTMNLKARFSVNEHAIRTQLLDKTFINRYTISYGMQQVNISKIEPVKSDDEKAKADSLDLQFLGVGKLTVIVKYNGTPTEFELNSEEGLSTLSFTEYGKYEVYLIDSMGTEATAVFSLDKKLNFSAIALIILSSIIVGVIVIFILRARGKVSTR